MEIIDKVIEKMKLRVDQSLVALAKRIGSTITSKQQGIGKHGTFYAIFPMDGIWEAKIFGTYNAADPCFTDMHFIVTFFSKEKGIVLVAGVEEYFGLDPRKGIRLETDWKIPPTELLDFFSNSLLYTLGDLEITTDIFRETP